uniref:Uncharacterized protein n=1 Tax=Arundo donax TaxID=35708 RepID=A0A0A9APZ9_ARUDO
MVTGDTKNGGSGRSISSVEEILN